jgi:hypothetical protein
MKKKVAFTDLPVTSFRLDKRTRRSLEKAKRKLKCTSYDELFNVLLDNE